MDLPELPEFAGPSLSGEPPFYFKNMTTSVFPLRAQVDVLQRFCDSYLNIIPEELGHFRASVPFVYLMMVDYGKMAVEAKNLGWISQREVLFCVPVEWYTVVDGRWIFHDWAAVAPFIYVDSPMSMTLGRTVWGWPKAMVNLSPQLTGWIQDPSGSTVDATWSAMTLPKAYAKANLENRVFMELRSPMSGGVQVPLDPGSPLMPWTIASNAMTAMANFAMDYLGFLRGLGLMPIRECASFDNFARRGMKAAAMMLPWTPNPVANTLNLKQFPRADEPEKYCFQALTNGPMRLTAFNRGSLLGQRAILAGDPSGGYSIDLVCWPSFPIVDTLGLRADVIGSVEGADIARLKPVLPFWYDVDMQYERGTTIAWRTVDGKWRDPLGRHVDSDPRPLEEDRRYNTTTGAGQPVLAGPFDFSSAFLRVLPLLARTEALQKLLEETLNVPLTGSGERFEVWSAGPDAVHAHVYVVATDWRVSSRTNDIGDWNEMALTFYVPVKRWVKGCPEGKECLEGVGLFPAYTLASRTSQACTLSELYGIPATDSTFVSPPVPFAPHEPHSLLVIDTEVMPSLGTGQESQKRTVIDVVHTGGPASAERVDLSDTAESFCRLLRQETLRKNTTPHREDLKQFEDLKQAGRLSALELLTLRRPLLVYTMKEFRDLARPDLACYQALIQIPYVIEEVKQIEESKQSICVRIHEYPSLPIVTKLGLVPRDVAAGDGSFVYTVEGVRPFLASGGLSMGNGVGLHYRDQGEWRPFSEEKTSTAGASPADARTAPGTEVPASPRLEDRKGARVLEETISRSKPLHLKSSVAEWLEGDGAKKSAGNGASRWWHTVDPQPVIESILSREWEDRLTTARRTKKRAEVSRQVVRDEAGWSSWLKDNLKMFRPMRLIEEREFELVFALRDLEPLLLTLDTLDELRPKDVGALEQELPIAWEAWERVKNTNAFYFVWPEENVRNLETLHSLWRENPDLRSKVTKDEFMSDEDARRQCSSFVRERLKALYPVAERRVEEAVDYEVEKHRKPDHCVLRSTAGLARDRLFPLEESWGDGTWYRGPKPSEEAPATPEVGAVEGHRSAE
jgi:hypothetical protein